MSPRTLLIGTAIATLPFAASAAGIERTPPTSRILFEDGRYLELSFASVNPTLKGTGGLLDASGSGTGDLLGRYASIALGYKADLTDRLSYAVIVDEPVGSDTLYPDVATSDYSGTEAEIDSLQITGILAYDLSHQLKIYGGLRAERVGATAVLPFFGILGGAPISVTYDVDGDDEWGTGYLVGAAYSRPEIALRVALTYYSKIEHRLDTVETVGSALGKSTFEDSVDIVIPESLTLEFQTGLMADTLLFGSVRWVDWSSFDIAPTYFTDAVGGPLLDYQEDWTTYTLGVGRKFSETWSGAVSVLWEPAAEYLPLTTLGPIDGRRSIGVAATYTRDNLKITGGLTYAKLGETENFAATEFDGGKAVGLGLRIGYTF